MTTRPAIRQRLADVTAGLGLPAPIFVREAADVLESSGNCATLLLDLGSCCIDRSLLAVVRSWAMAHPDSEVVLFAPLLERERELKVATRLLTTVRGAEVRVMTATEFFHDHAWRRLRLLREHATLETELRTEFLRAVRETGRPLPAESIVLQLLSEAPVLPHRAATAKPTLGRGRMRAVGARQARWRLLRRAGQMPASWLLVIFRMLWEVKLRERHWPAGRIAAFLGFRSARHLRRTVHGRLGVRVHDLTRIRYDQALRWAAALVTGDHAHDAGRPVRTLVTALLDGGQSSRTCDAAGREGIDDRAGGASPRQGPVPKSLPRP